MTSTHKIDATIGVGDPDLGAEVELRIVYTYHPDVAAVMYEAPQPGEPAHVEFVSCLQILGGKEYEQSGSFADYEQSSLDAVASSWIESDEGRAQAIEQALDDLQRGRDA